ncbi:hypothetical protein V8E36_006932 [Tilletia maclaganii]
MTDDIYQRFNLPAPPPPTFLSRDSSSARARFPNFTTSAELHDYVRELAHWAYPVWSQRFLLGVSIVLLVYLVAFSILIGVNFRRRSWQLWRLERGESGTLIMPHAHNGLLFCGTIFLAVVCSFLLHIYVSITHDRHIDHLPIWVTVTFMPLALGVWWQFCGIIAASIPRKLAGKRSLSMSSFIPPWVLNATFVLGPLLGFICFIVPTVLSDLAWSRVQNELWPAFEDRYRDAPVLTRDMLLDAQLIWDQMLRMSFMLSIALLVWVIVGSIIVGLYVGFVWHTTIALSAFLARLEDRAETLQQAQPFTLDTVPGEEGGGGGQIGMDEDKAQEVTWDMVPSYDKSRLGVLTATDSDIEEKTRPLSSARSNTVGEGGSVISDPSFSPTRYVPRLPGAVLPPALPKASVPGFDPNRATPPFSFAATKPLSKSRQQQQQQHERKDSRTTVATTFGGGTNTLGTATATTATMFRNSRDVKRASVGAGSSVVMADDAKLHVCKSARVVLWHYITLCTCISIGGTALVALAAYVAVYLFPATEAHSIRNVLLSALVGACCTSFISGFMLLSTAHVTFEATFAAIVQAKSPGGGSAGAAQEAAAAGDGGAQRRLNDALVSNGVATPGGGGGANGSCGGLLFVGCGKEGCDGTHGRSWSRARNRTNARANVNKRKTGPSVVIVAAAAEAEMELRAMRAAPQARREKGILKVQAQPQQQQPPGGGGGGRREAGAALRARIAGLGVEEEEDQGVPSSTTTTTAANSTGSLGRGSSVRSTRLHNTFTPLVSPPSSTSTLQQPPPSSPSIASPWISESAWLAAPRKTSVSTLSSSISRPRGIGAGAGTAEERSPFGLYPTSTPWPDPASSSASTASATTTAAAAAAAAGTPRLPGSPWVAGPQFVDLIVIQSLRAAPGSRDGRPPQRSPFASAAAEFVAAAKLSTDSVNEVRIGNGWSGEDWRAGSMGRAAAASVSLFPSPPLGNGTGLRRLSFTPLAPSSTSSHSSMPVYSTAPPPPPLPPAP